MACGHLARPFFFRWNDKPRGGGLGKSSGCRFNLTQGQGTGWIAQFWRPG